MDIGILAWIVLATALCLVISFAVTVVHTVIDAVKFNDYTDLAALTLYLVVAVIVIVTMI